LDLFQVIVQAQIQIGRPAFTITADDLPGASGRLTTCRWTRFELS
jgi:hypothetical protein